MNQQRIIELDPYFDRRDTGQPSPALQAMQHSSPGQAYGTPETEQLMHMRSTTTGLRGTLIPRATIGGIPQGSRPHTTQDVVVHIDPHIAGQSSMIRLGDINAKNVARATQAVTERMGEPSDIVGLRVQGAAILHTLASGHDYDAVKQAQAAPSRQPQPVIPQPMMASHAVVHRQMHASQPQSQPQPPQQVPQMQQAPQMQQPRRINPLMTLNRPQQQPPLRNLREIDFPAESPPVIAAPQVQVVFEVEHFGRLDVNYHDVIVEQGFLVLVFDNRYQGAMKYFPPVQQGDTPARMAVNVIGTDEAYEVQTTGVQFSHDSREFCVLMIDRTWNLTTG